MAGGFGTVAPMPPPLVPPRFDRLLPATSYLLPCLVHPPLPPPAGRDLGPVPFPPTKGYSLPQRVSDRVFPS